ncbi:hypothetical protein OUZ56_017535 [Daphnia magna]|uniref:Uncharacterized protein n=1 Tax=Daphnia magna TaxID=35525 RepID=A0ABR0AT72_9CRUS|nr:hypothetical protein OUZ56_017535 [Daphnia magna]
MKQQTSTVIFMVVFSLCSARSQLKETGDESFAPLTKTSREENSPVSRLNIVEDAKGRQSLPMLPRPSQLCAVLSNCNPKDICYCNEFCYRPNGFPSTVFAVDELPRTSSYGLTRSFGTCCCNVYVFRRYHTCPCANELSDFCNGLSCTSSDANFCAIVSSLFNEFRTSCNYYSSVSYQCLFNLLMKHPFWSVGRGGNSGSESEADSSQPTHPVLSVIGQRLFCPPRHQQQFQGTAMAAVRKFTSPPIFLGNPIEDARQWLECYETISSPNGWGDADKRKNFSVYLDDTERNWFLCARLPNDLQDTAAQAAAGENLTTPAVPGLQASLTSDTREWKDTTVELQKPHEQLPNLSLVYPDHKADFMKTMRELIEDICEKLISKERNEQLKIKGPFKPTHITQGIPSDVQQMSGSDVEYIFLMSSGKPDIRFGCPMDRRRTF